MLVSVLRSADGKFYRQGVENADELVNGFPKSEEDLFKYDAMIIGSIEATFFTFDQLKAVEQFVSRRGGTLLALGGSKAFNAGGYGNTPLADLLPIYLNGREARPPARVRLSKPRPPIEAATIPPPGLSINPTPMRRRGNRCPRSRCPKSSPTSSPALR